MRQRLDEHITGHWGEDQFSGEDESMDKWDEIADKLSDEWFRALKKANQLDTPICDFPPSFWKEHDALYASALRQHVREAFEKAAQVASKQGTSFAEQARAESGKTAQSLRDHAIGAENAAIGIRILAEAECPSTEVTKT